MVSISQQLLPLALRSAAYTKSMLAKLQLGRGKLRGMNMQCLSSEIGIKASKTTEYEDELTLITRRDVIGLIFGVSSLSLCPSDAEVAGLPPEEKPKLCDDECEKELENVPMVTTESGLQYKDIKVGEDPSPPVGFQVAADCVAMVPSEQIFDRSAIYLPRGIWSGDQGLDEGILSMKVGGKCRLYIPRSLAFLKGLTSAPGRPRVAPNSPVIFDGSLEYIPGLELDEE